MENYLEYLNESPTIFFKCSSKSAWAIEFVTKNVKELLGYDEKYIISNKMNFIDFVYADDIEELKNSISIAISSNVIKSELNSYRVVTNDNKILWVKDITKIIRNDKGEVTHFYCYITNISNEKELSEKLNLSEDIISTIYNNSFQFIGLMNIDGTLIKANKTSLKFINAKESDVVGKKFWNTPWWEDSTDEQNTLEKEIKEAALGKLIRTVKIHFDNNGKKIYVDFSIKPVFNSKNEVVYLIPEGHDITQSVLKQKQLNRYYDIINENVLISTTDLDGRILDCSNKFEKACEYTKDELFGNRHTIMKHPDTSDELYKDLWDTIRSGKVWSGEYQNISKNGRVYWLDNVITPNLNEKNQVESYTSIYQDITQQKDIAELLITDVLTNLYNRRYFNTVFKKELKRCIRNNTSFVLIMIDIDYFKQYNDTYGHQEGDIALISVANSLRKSINRPEDYVFRLGGEEFCVITSGVVREGAIELANKLRNNIESLHIEHSKNTSSQYLTISLGIKLVEHDFYLDDDDIYKLADDALYKAKREGRNRVCISQKNK